MTRDSGFILNNKAAQAATSGKSWQPEARALECADGPHPHGPLTGYVAFGRLLLGTSVKMGFGPRPPVTQGWVCLGLSYNLGLPSSLALVSHGLNISLLPRERRQQSRGRHSSGPGLFSWPPALALQGSWLLVLVSGKVCTLLQSWLISVLPYYSQARKAGLWAGSGCQIFMPALSVGEGLIQQGWVGPSRFPRPSPSL